MNIIRQFINDLFHMPRYLFFRIYFGKALSVVALYFSLLMLAGAYTYKSNDFKIYRGNLADISFNEIGNKQKGPYMVELKLVDHVSNFESFAIDMEQKSFLESRLQPNSIYEIYTQRIAPGIIFFNRKINLIKDINGIIIYKYSINYKNNLMSGLFLLFFGIWLFWISSKR